MKAIIYLRVSTEEQAEKGFSIQAQREECAKKAHELGCYEIIEFCDEGVSGSILERPGLISALNRMAAAGDIKYFICLDSSRLSRNVSHQLIILDEIKRLKVQLVFVKNTYEDSPEGRFQITIMSAVDEYERARFRFRSELGKRTKASQGKLTHSPGLYGYDYDKENDVLIINTEESAVIRMMYQLALEGNGPHAIAVKLNDMGIPTKKNKLWQKATVKRMLVNSAYKGTLYIRRYDSRDVKFNKYKPPEEKVSVKERPRDEWVPVSVPAIVDEKTWDEVQCIMKNARRKWSNYSKAAYLLSALIRCGICGRTVHGNLAGNRYRKYRYYVCTGRSPGEMGSEKCKLGFINADQLEMIIWERVLRWLKNPGELENEIRKGIPDNLEDKEVRIEELRKQVDRLNKEKDRVATMYQKDLISESDMERRLKDIKNKLYTLSETEKTISNDIISYKTQQDEINQISQVANKIMGRIENLDFEDKREIVRLLVSEVIVTRDTIRIKAKVPTIVQDIDI